jgi:putative endopeptidase
MRPIRTLSLFAALAALALAASPALCAAPALSRADMDTTVAPCQDFFRYADGGWIARTEMPAAYSRYGAFEMLGDQNLDQVHVLLEKVVTDAKRTPAAGNLALLAAYYGAAMDSARAEKDGMTPIRPALARIEAIPDRNGIAAEVARLHAESVPALFGFMAMADPGNSNLTIATLNQGGLSLPDRDYYFKGDSASRAIRDAFLAHVKRTFVLLGEPEAVAEAHAQSVMTVETELARPSMTRVQQRDPRAVYHKMALADFERTCPGFDWKAYFAGTGAPAFGELNVRQPGFFAALDSTLRQVPVGDWRTYLRWNVVQRASGWLSSPFVAEDFRFQQVLSGAKQMQPRWRRALESTDRALGDPLGEVYVATYFTPETKARALEMVKNLKAALRDRIVALTWMSEPTKQQALRKLDAMGIKIGWPDQWRDYSRLKLAAGSFLANQQRAARFERAYRLGKIGQPVDKTEFSMTPPTVNARYSPSLNDILFPAGILQPPFFDPNADDAVNYGGIGTVIGHEMTHGFDDSGRQYDADGNLEDWWQPDDAKKYQEQADRIIKQYDAYTVLDTVHVNGKLTTGENIADLGGLTVSYAALQKALAGRPQESVDGFAPGQRFFLAYARLWRQIARPAESLRRINTDPHSPGVWRVRGPLANMPEFEQAFGCAGSSAMIPEEQRAKIW